MPQWLEKEVGGIPTWGWLLAGGGILVAVWYFRRNVADTGGEPEGTNMWGGPVGIGPEEAGQGVDYATDALFGAADDLASQQEEFTSLMDLLLKGQVRERKLLKRLASKQTPKNKDQLKLPDLSGKPRDQVKILNRMINRLQIGGVKSGERAWVRILRKRRNTLRSSIGDKDRQGRRPRQRRHAEQRRRRREPNDTRNRRTHRLVIPDRPRRGSVQRRRVRRRRAGAR